MQFNSLVTMKFFQDVSVVIVIPVIIYMSAWYQLTYSKKNSSTITNKDVIKDPGNKMI